MSRPSRFFLALLLCSVSGLARPDSDHVSNSLAQARQLVLVTAHDWGSTSGTLQRFQRDKPSSRWLSVDLPVKVNLGRNGLGWGRGLHAMSARQGPVKREGDGRAPAGAFQLTGLFGYLDSRSLAVRTVKMPYLEATADLQCVDDVGSGYYNRIVHRSQLKALDWNSAENMRRPDGIYFWGAYIAHNTAPTLPNAGSCIFLHVWEAENVPTSGCTAGNAADIAQIFLWLDVKAQPIIVQLPESEYLRLKGSWALP